MSKHTPTPWSNDYAPPSTGFGSGYGKSQILDTRNRPIAAVALVEPEVGPLYRGGGFSKEALDTLEANAAFIVKAVNCHDKLLAALKLYAKLDNDRRAGCEIADSDWAECHQAAMSTIAAAEKEG